MKATKLVIGSALLIAATALAIPSVAAEGVGECVQNRVPVLGGTGSPTDIPSCEVSHFTDCTPLLMQDQILYAECLAAL